MTISEFAASECFTDVTHCYIAVMPWEGQYTLEVEVDEGTIAGEYRTEESDLDTARIIANELDAELTRRGVKVFFTRDAWTKHLENNNVSE